MELFSGVETQAKPRTNFLYYGDNLTIMDLMPNSCVDLIYLDPPFNSQRVYNLIYTQMTGLPIPEQENAFCDAWVMDAEKEEMIRNMPLAFERGGVSEDVLILWRTWEQALRKTQPELLAYLVYMTFRLAHMRRILRPTGSIYLHCDPAASHYIKVMMDGIFGHQNFRSEIIWKRTSAHSSAKRYGPVHDVILFYTMGDTYTWNKVFQPYDKDYIATFFDQKDEDGRVWKRTDLTGAGTRNGETGQVWRGIDVTAKGRHWAWPPSQLEEFDRLGKIHWPKKAGGMPRLKQYPEDLPGVPLQDVWTDIPPMHNLSKERLGYPTQKPLAVLRRIIAASSNPGDVVFDPFCGCGTTVCAAHELDRHWIGCDIAILSVQIVREVLLKRYGLKDKEHFEVAGVPVSVEGARELAERDKRQFQHWAVELAGGFCNTKHAGDEGVDGRIYTESEQGLRSMVLSVKGGKHVSPDAVRDLLGTLGSEPSAWLAGLICLDKPTKGMRAAAAKAGVMDYLGTRYERVQIRTVEQLLNGEGFSTPSVVQKLNAERQGLLPLGAAMHSSSPTKRRRHHAHAPI